jgi:hypothetical protein
LLILRAITDLFRPLGLFFALTRTHTRACLFDRSFARSLVRSLTPPHFLSSHQHIAVTLDASTASTPKACIYIGGERVASSTLAAPTLRGMKRAAKAAAGCNIMVLPLVDPNLVLKVSEVRIWGSRRDERDIEDTMEEPLEIAVLDYEGDGYSERAAMFSEGERGPEEKSGTLKKKKKKKGGGIGVKMKKVGGGGGAGFGGLKKPGGGLAKPKGGLGGPPKAVARRRKK